MLCPGGGSRSAPPPPPPPPGPRGAGAHHVTGRAGAQARSTSAPRVGLARRDLPPGAPRSWRSESPASGRAATSPASGARRPASEVPGEGTFAGAGNWSEPANKPLAREGPRGTSEVRLSPAFFASCIFLIAKITFVHWKCGQRDVRLKTSYQELARPARANFSHLPASPGCTRLPFISTLRTQTFVRIKSYSVLIKCLQAYYVTEIRKTLKSLSTLQKTNQEFSNFEETLVYPVTFPQLNPVLNHGVSLSLLRMVSICPLLLQNRA
ncbi:uncharacterized protein LOC111164285 [Delphinapterus leucas]|uniref:Uncharacterized protein LOC111164285 n=1 Tax=Delphinapterus leucas TaxID=9749 RepID=A0A7F8KB26_DELLE|nr:uncharacterized protein LOC111164285 [Delphinapterus leucas]